MGPKKRPSLPARVLKMTREEIDSERKKLASDIRETLLNFPNGLPAPTLPDKFLAVTGKTLDPQSCGFQSLNDMLMKMRNTILRAPDGLLYLKDRLRVEEIRNSQEDSHEDVTLKIIMIVENKAAQKLITEKGEKIKELLEDSKGVGSVEIEVVKYKNLLTEKWEAGKSSSAEAPAGSQEQSANMPVSGSSLSDEHFELETTPSVKTPSDSVATELENKTSEPRGEASPLKNAHSELETSQSVRTPSHFDAEAAKKPPGPTRETSIPNTIHSELAERPSVGTPFDSAAEMGNIVSGTTREASIQNTAHSKLEKDVSGNNRSGVEAADIANTRSLWPSKSRETSLGSSAHSELEQSPSGGTPLDPEAEITKRSINDGNSDIASAYKSIFTAEVPNKGGVEEDAGRVAPTLALSSVSSATADITPVMSIRERFALISPLGPLIDPLKRTTDPFAIPLDPLPNQAVQSISVTAPLNSPLPDQAPSFSVTAPLMRLLPIQAPCSSVPPPLIPPRNVMRVGPRGRGWVSGDEPNSRSMDSDGKMPKGRGRGVVHRSENE